MERFLKAANLVLGVAWVVLGVAWLVQGDNLLGITDLVFGFILTGTSWFLR